MKGPRKPGEGTFPHLHIITDADILQGQGFREMAARLLEDGGEAVALHLRAPDTGPLRLWTLAEELLPTALSSGGRLQVNDRVDVALAVPGVGVHLRGDSLPTSRARKLLGPHLFMGRSIHAAEEAWAEEEGGADYLLLGTIYPTASHPGVTGCGVGGIRHVGSVSSTPLVAIGGITPERVAEVRGTGAWGVAVLRGIWGSADPLKAMNEFLTGWEAA
ncbi:MAG: thiamine phosphate synthase [Gemmatimonadota bacterium]